MIVSAEFKNFRALRDVKIDLEPFTVIVGPNSCGKSTILNGLNSIVNGIPSESFDLRRSILDWESNTVVIRASLKESDSESINYTFSEGVFKTKVGNSPYFSQKLTSLRAILLSPNSDSMSQPSYGASFNPVLEFDGRGLATICANIQMEHPELFDRVQSYITRIIPNVKRFRVKRAKTNSYIGGGQKVGPEAIGEEIIFDFFNISSVPASHVSEGTLTALCILIAAARVDNEHMLVLLDDLERGLHPKATRDLVNVLRDLQKENPNLQIIATTHSPYLLDHFEPKEVRVAALDPVRGTVIARLDESPDFDKWHEVLNTGELWSHVGEKWVLERDVSKNDSRESV